MVYSANEMFQISELQTDAFWKVTFTAGPLASYSDDLAKRIIASDLPKPDPKNITAQFHGYEFEIPGIVSYKATVVMTFVEPVDVKVATASMDFFKKNYSADETSDVTGTQTTSHSDLFNDFKLEPANRQDSTTQTFTAHKALIQSFDPGIVLGDGNSPSYAKPTITFTVNWYNWQSSGVSPS